MRHTLKIAALLVLLMVVLADCKKSKKEGEPPVTYLDSGINGVRQWTGTQIAPYMDSAGGAFLYDTTYWNFSMQITAYSDSEIYLYFDSSINPERLTPVASAGLNTVSFVYIPYPGGYQGYYLDDSISYNYVNDSIVWTRTLYPGGEPPTFISAHTL